MLKKLLHSALIGLATAAIILYILPQINHTLFDDGVISYRTAVQKASPAVVNVYNQSFTTANSNYQTKVNNLGSGVIMSEDGYILTNKHVIQDADQIVVALQNGHIYEADLVGSDSLTDLAVLKIKANNLSTIPQKKNRYSHVGDVVLAIGNPYNLGQSVSQGIISALGRNAVGDYIGRQNFIQTDASINKGNSGGALINSKGELIGISTLSIGKDSTEIAEGLSFAIPIELANDIMRKIIQDGRVIRGYLGVQSDVLFNNGQGISNKGILISNVQAGSPADNAGIEAGDIIIEFNNTKATSPVQMMKAILNTKPGTTIEVVILRMGKTIKLPVTIQEYIIQS
ncbi:DegS peptidase [Bisgaardia hudsonensis]|uniref:Serine endoprotease DegS n=1 Tax=Bisgaardia hudsonensis TaxID=109472 RepID=A0A4R2N1S0_9PAST|nr:outer membrane-stress sensor serine endopeptidase DegS [Bisgaardia hudsonensis]QLB12953.1 outer membrane-stress sensor serine endopeptidase DegS [Bisgaardia hudsonensis]TCP13486.1 DegS peptidase [Bisgaardia hudsonensis]